MRQNRKQALRKFRKSLDVNAHPSSLNQTAVNAHAVTTDDMGTVAMDTWDNLDTSSGRKASKSRDFIDKSEEDMWLETETALKDMTKQNTDNASGYENEWEDIRLLDPEEFMPVDDDDDIPCDKNCTCRGGRSMSIIGKERTFKVARTLRLKLMTRQIYNELEFGNEICCPLRCYQGW